LFRPSDLGSFSPHSDIIDVAKYAGRKGLSKEFKELIYRPPRVKTLYEKYWHLARIVEGRVKIENDREILKDHRIRYPQKPLEEVKLIERILQGIERIIEEDKRATDYKTYNQQ
jgi:hypothetical protein